MNHFVTSSIDPYLDELLFLPYIVPNDNNYNIMYFYSLYMYFICEGNDRFL